MAQISIPKRYRDGTVYLESDVDDIRDTITSFINVTRLNDDNIQDSGITASDKLIDATVSTANLASDSITTTSLASEAVTWDKKEARAVSTDGSDPGLGGVSRSSEVTSTINSTTLTDVSGSSTTITTNGGPIVLTLVPVGTVIEDRNVILDLVNNTTSETRITGNIAITLSDNTVKAQSLVSLAPDKALTLNDYSVSYLPGAFWVVVSDLGAGTHTFKLRAKVSTTEGEIRFSRIGLAAYEI